MIAAVALVVSAALIALGWCAAVMAGALAERQGSDIGIATLSVISAALLFAGWIVSVAA